MATIKDVAKAAGISVSTVSIVINGKSRERSIPETTQEKVFKAMHDLGYQPNVNARKLRSGEKESPVIAFFWPLDFRLSILAAFLNAFSREIERSGFDCELVVQTYEVGNLAKYDKHIIGNKYQGVIIGACTGEDIRHLEMIRPQIPVVLINRDSDSFSTVGISNQAVGELAASQFRKKGFEEAAIFHSSHIYMASSMRVEAFLSSCEKYGIRIAQEHIYTGNSTLDGGYHMAESFCGKQNRPKAIFCDSDAIAIGALKAFNENRIRIPEEAAVLSMDVTSSDISRYCFPSLSVVEMPSNDIGKNVISLLREKLESGSSEPEHIILRPALILRESFPA